MTRRRYDSVWDAIEDTPSHAENMRLRSELMRALKTFVVRERLSQADAARMLRVTQPRMSDLLRGKITLFSLDTLVNMAADAGMHVEMRIAAQAPPEQVAHPS